MEKNQSIVLTDEQRAALESLALDLQQQAVKQSLQSAFLCSLIGVNHAEVSTKAYNLWSEFYQDPTKKKLDD